MNSNNTDSQAALFELRVVTGDAVDLCVPLTEGQFIIGSSPSADLCLAKTGISRHHARLEILQGGAVLTDLGSKNGTFVAGDRIERRVLSEYAVLAFGSVRAVLSNLEHGSRDLAVKASGEMPTPSPQAPAAERSTQELGLVDSLTNALGKLLERLASGRIDQAQWPLEFGGLLLEHLPVTAVQIRENESVTLAVGDLARDPGCGKEQGNDDSSTARPSQVVRAESAGRILEVWTHRPEVMERLQPLLCMLAGLWTIIGVTTTTDGIPPGPPPNGIPEPEISQVSIPDGQVISRNPQVQALYRRSRRVARGSLPVLILGSSGAGKDGLARYFHAHSPRNDGPYLALNCAALPRDLLEAELFGIERGVATGVEQRPGLLERASGGTLFLDEIGDMPLETQAKVLRVLEGTELYRLGGRRPVTIDVRFVAATNRDPLTLVEEGSFRQDLYHRLAAFVIRLPPLAERPEDIPGLATHFFHREVERNALLCPGITRRALVALMHFSWPGNVRQLHNEIARAALLTDAGQAVDLEHFSDEVQIAGAPSTANAVESAPLSLADAVERAEAQTLRMAIAAANDDPAEACALLGTSRSTFYRKLKEFGLKITDQSEY